MVREDNRRSCDGRWPQRRPCRVAADVRRVDGAHRGPVCKGGAAGRRGRWCRVCHRRPSARPAGRLPSRPRTAARRRWRTGRRRSAMCFGRQPRPVRPAPLPRCAARSPTREGRPCCARRHPPCESATRPHVPIRGSRTDRAGGTTPRQYQLHPGLDRLPTVGPHRHHRSPPPTQARPGSHLTSRNPSRQAGARADVERVICAIQILKSSPISGMTRPKLLQRLSEEAET